MEGLDHLNSSASPLCKLHTTFVIDPHNFWAQIGPEEKLADFVCFEHQIHDHCEQHQTSEAYLGDHIPADQLVFVKSPKQKKWLRAEVMRSVENTLDVFYPDYGTAELVPWTSVCQNVPHELTTSYHYAFRCQLIGIQPIAKSWTSRATKCFKALAQDKTLDALVLFNVDQYGTMQVALYTGEDHNYRSVTHLLLEEEVGLPWEVENVPEYSYEVLPGWFTQTVKEPDGHSEATPNGGDEEEPSGSDTNSELSLNSSASGPVARIPSFDTAAMETSNDVTLEMLKINAVMENQKKNRTQYKQQLKDLTADFASEMLMYGGPVEDEEGTTDTGDVVDEIHSIIRKTESSTSTDTDHADRNLSHSSSSKTELAHKSSCNRISSPFMGRGRGRNKNRSSSNSPAPEDKRSRSDDVPVKANEVNNVGVHSASTGRGRGRSKNRSASNSPIPGGHTRRPEADRKQAQEPEQFSSPVQKKKPPCSQQKGNTNKVRKKDVMSPREFHKKLTSVLNLIEREGLKKHWGRFEDLLHSNKGRGRMSEMLEAVLDKAVKLYETFASVAVVLLSHCQNFDNFEESLDSALCKLQSKYVRIHNKQVYYYESYSKLLGDLFVSSASWNDTVCLSLRLYVVKTLDKWIYFNMKKRQPSSEPLQQLYITCFVELWGQVHEILHSTMTSQWELIVEGMREKIESDQTPRDIRGQMLNLLLSTFKSGVTTEAVKPGPVSDVGCQASSMVTDRTTQTSDPRHVHQACQANLSSEPSPAKKAEVLLTPEELVKGDVRNLQSPDQFVVPKFTLPISPEDLQNDARLSPLSLTYSRSAAVGRPGQSDPFSQSLPWGRGRCVQGLAAQTKPFFPLMSQDEEHAPGDCQENSDVRKVMKGVSKPQLLTPDVFTEANDLGNGHGDCQLKNLPGDFTSKKSEVERREELIPEHSANFNNSNMFSPQSEPSKGPANMVNRKLAQKQKKRQLIDLSTGKTLGTENSQTPVIQAPSQARQTKLPTFSYAAALGAPKQDIDEKSKSNSGLSIKSIAMDLLREPSEPEPNLPVPGSEPPHSAEQATVPEGSPREATLSTASSAQSGLAYCVDNEEFPTLREAESMHHQKPKPKVPISKSEREVGATSDKLVPSEFAFSDGEGTDDDDEWFLGEAAPAEPTPQAANSQLGNSWKPGQRKCLICGDVYHLVYDCPNKNKNFILS